MCLVCDTTIRSMAIKVCFVRSYINVYGDVSVYDDGGATSERWDGAATSER